MKPRALLSWSSGKDSAWCLHVLRQQNEIEVVGLLTTFNEAADRVAMHGVRRELVEAQANAAGLPLLPVMLPSPCTNQEYEARLEEVIVSAKSRGTSHFAFGDLFLGDIRHYRERQMGKLGIAPAFPLWTTPSRTAALARKMLAAGLRAIVTCVDPNQLSETFAGREFDARFLGELPGGVDPCGERGEFHTICYDGPMFKGPIPVRVGSQVVRDGFCFSDVVSSRGDSVAVPI